MSLRILIAGAGGQVGSELCRSFANLGEVLAADRQTADFVQPERARALVRNAQPDIILNAAAYTAVDKAESEPALAEAINAEAPRVLAEEAQRSHALLVHYSTDYVFDGARTSPWNEDDLPAPLNVYGASKLSGERAIQSVGGRTLIFRTSWVYGPQGKNFLLTMLRLAREREELRIVDDQRGAPTTSAALADATRSVVDAVLSGQCGEPEDWAGIYHMTCAGAVSWCGFAQAIFARAQELLDNHSPRVIPIPSAEHPTAARRPLNSVLSCEKLARTFAVRLPAWEDALDKVLHDLRSQQISA